MLYPIQFFLFNINNDKVINFIIIKLKNKN